jgi:hypothetical protein
MLIALRVVQQFFPWFTLDGALSDPTSMSRLTGDGLNSKKRAPAQPSLAAVDVSDLICL